MTDLQEYNIRTWIKSWKQAGDAMQEMKHQKLRNMDYSSHRDRIDEMLQWAVDHRKMRNGSGLVELQRYLRKLRNKSL